MRELATRWNASFDENEWMQFAAAKVTWRHGQLNDLIEAVAEDVEDFVLFAILERRTAYAPYDGGADLILAGEGSVAAARSRWRSWLSAHPLGL